MASEGAAQDGTEIKLRAAFQSQVSQSFSKDFQLFFVFSEWLFRVGAGAVPPDKQAAALFRAKL